MSQRRRESANVKLPSRFLIIGGLLGALIGIIVGLNYGWNINPVVGTDVSPWQLNHDGRTNWIIAASLAWARDGDIVGAANRLNALHLSDRTFQVVADTACELARSSYAQSQSGLIAIRSMVNLAAGQGKASCAADLISLNSPTPAPTITVIAPTKTLPPPPTKTPTLPPGATITPGATEGSATATPAAGKFQVVRYEPYCSAKAPGLIGVYVQDASANGIPGIEVHVSGANGTDRFFTGLKPEIDDGYADFTMEAGETYTVTLANNAERSEDLKASPCTDKETGTSITVSYRVFFRRVPR